ncbi:MAG TPA: tetratricopeptide repeat protein [Candidatus Obscuribacterales bacterium]
MTSQVSLKSLTTTVLLTLTTSIISVYSAPASQTAAPLSVHNNTLSDRLAQGNPADLEALMNQGIAALDDGNYTEALNYFDQAIALNPTHAPAYTGQGLAFYYLN